MVLITEDDATQLNINFSSTSSRRTKQTDSWQSEKRREPEHSQEESPSLDGS
jgi:hypothetical protein